MRATDYINQLRSRQYSSTPRNEIGVRKIATLNALKRLRLKKMVVNPCRGFYLIVPPEYQILGCLPAEMFIPDLMQYLDQPYYVGFISGAANIMAPPIKNHSDFKLSL